MRTHARFISVLVAAALAFAVPARAHAVTPSSVTIADQTPGPNAKKSPKPPNPASAARPTPMPAKTPARKPAPVQTMKPPIETMKPVPTRKPAPRPTPAPTKRPVARPTPKPTINPWHPNRKPYYRAPASNWHRPAWADYPRPPWIHSGVYRPNYVLVNPRPYAYNWGWNGGSQWYPQTNYWGGGFWGPFAVFSLLAGQAMWNQNRYTAPSYAYPGWYVFQNYGLQSTPCGRQNLVYIYGPNNGVMCAYPNEYVVSGAYYVDPASLQLYVM